MECGPGNNGKETLADADAVYIEKTTRPRTGQPETTYRDIDEIPFRANKKESKERENKNFTDRSRG